MDIWFYQHWLSGNDIFREVETMKMTHHNQIRLFWGLAGIRAKWDTMQRFVNILAL